MTSGQRIRRLLVLSVITITAAFAVRLAAPPVRDWWILRDYQPPAAVEQLVVDTTMTDAGKRLFYINRPAVLDRSEFNQHCHGTGEHTIILGCYHSPQRGIFIFHVDEPELEGIEQVTAAHEMLHAAYDRLSRSERQRIDDMMMAYYLNELRDERILRVMELYKNAGTDHLTNEMHSIFGTEIAELPEEMEQYYKQYFTNRSRVAGFAAQYQQAFTSRQRQITEYDNQLARLEEQIKQNEAMLSQQAAQLNADRPVVEASNDQEMIDAYNQQVAAHNTLLAQANALVDEYNRVVARRNEIALEQKQLQHSIDSSIQ